jgi:hypothetical protein
MSYRLGADVGGTFTDVLLVDEQAGSTWRAKTSSTPQDQSAGAGPGRLVTARPPRNDHSASVRLRSGIEIPVSGGPMAEGSVTRARPAVTFGVLALGVAAFALLQSLVIPVLTTVQHQLHTTQAAVTWVLTAYLLSASVMTPILGRIGDMAGKKRVFVLTLAALAVARCWPRWPPRSP